MSDKKKLFVQNRDTKKKKKNYRRQVIKVRQNETVP